MSKISTNASTLVVPGWDTNTIFGRTEDGCVTINGELAYPVDWMKAMAEDATAGALYAESGNTVYKVTPNSVEVTERSWVTSHTLCDGVWVTKHVFLK